MVMEMSLNKIELEAWSQRAHYYDEMFAAISTQAIDDILDSFGNLQGKKHLDVACGTGHLVAAASKRGAISMGYDFAPAMIEVARVIYPQDSFGIADAKELPFDDCSLDVVSCAFGLSHIENPQAAVAEAFRILKPGGQFTFTLWFGPDDGSDLTAIWRDAIALYAGADISLPDSWTRLRYANEGACESAVKQAGFDSHQFRRLPIIMKSISAQVALDMMDKLSIRSKMILDRQTLSTKHRIRKYVLSETEALRKNGVISIQWPALLTTARKSS